MIMATIRSIRKSHRALYWVGGVGCAAALSVGIYLAPDSSESSYRNLPTMQLAEAAVRVASSPEPSSQAREIAVLPAAATSRPPEAHYLGEFSPAVGRARNASLCAEYLSNGVGHFTRVVHDGDLANPEFAAAYESEKHIVEEAFGSSCKNYTASEIANWRSDLDQLALGGDMTAKAYLTRSDVQEFLIHSGDSPDSEEAANVQSRQIQKAQLISRAEQLVDEGYKPGLRLLSSLLINDTAATDDELLSGLAAIAGTAVTDDDQQRMLEKYHNELEPEQYATMMMNLRAYQARLSNPHRRSEPQ